jgi:hypothetical protein
MALLDYLTFICNPLPTLVQQRLEKGFHVNSVDLLQMGSHLGDRPFLLLAQLHQSLNSGEVLSLKGFELQHFLHILAKLHHLYYLPLNAGELSRDVMRE